MGKQIEMAVSPCRWVRTEIGAVSKVEPKKHGGAAHEYTVGPRRQGGLRRDPIQPPFRHPGKRRLSCYRDEKPLGVPLSVPPSFGASEKLLILNESVETMVPTLG